MKYTVEIRETLSRLVQVDAPDCFIAKALVEDKYNKAEIVITSDDFFSVEFKSDEKELPSYYKSANKDFTLIQGDCVETLSKFEFDFDMVFADPPYFLSSGGISCNSGRVVCVDKGEWDKPTTSEDMDAFNMRWLSACRAHMKDNATIWISGTHHNIFSVQQQLLKLGFKILNVITWAKTNPPPNISCRFFTHSAEFIIWARKLPKVPHYYNYDLMRELNGGKQMTDVWPLPAIGKWEKSCGKHPTQKPLAILARIIQASTKPGAWILDPFSGSGTTGIAASLLGRRFLGLEIEEEYLKIAAARRTEIDNLSINSNYLDRLSKAKIISQVGVANIASDSEDAGYGASW